MNLRDALENMAIKHGISADLPEADDPMFELAAAKLLERIEDAWCRTGHVSHSILFRSRPREKEERMDMIAVIGDVHGDLELLRALVQGIEGEARSRPARLTISSVGDLIDRGPSSADVIEFVVRRGIQCVSGNHELWLHQLAVEREFDDFALKPFMGGAATLESYGFEKPWTDSNLRDQVVSRIPFEHREFLRRRQLLRVYEIGVGAFERTILLSHGGISRAALTKLRHDLRSLPEIDLMSDIDLMEVALRVEPRWGSQILWGSTKLKDQAIMPGVYSVSGHVPYATPGLLGAGSGAAIAVDTGCATAYDRKLSAVVFLSSHTEAPNQAFFLSVSRSEGLVRSQTVTLP